MSNGGDCRTAPATPGLLKMGNAGPPFLKLYLFSFSFFNKFQFCDRIVMVTQIQYTNEATIQGSSD